MGAGHWHGGDHLIEVRRGRGCIPVRATLMPRNPPRHRWRQTASLELGSFAMGMARCAMIATRVDHTAMPSAAQARSAGASAWSCMACQ